MPFWDRSIDIVALTHPEHDHLAGLAVVAARYRIGTFIHSDIGDDRPEYQALHRLIVAAHTPIRTIIAGDSVRISGATLSAVWPSANQVAMMRPLGEAKGAVLGAASGSEHVNDGSLVMWLRYGTFDMLLAGDADIRVQPWYTGTHLADEVVEVLKVPHHGSRTGMTDSFISWLHPGLAVISVGRNTYGHPDRRTIAALEAQGARVMRTDEMGDVHIVSDGVTWSTEAVIKPTVEKMKGGLATPGRF
jgi:competence protein ComEC